MRAKAFSLVLVGLVIAAAILVQIQAPLTNREVLISEQEARPAPAAVPEAAKPRVVAAYGKLPLSFEANQGQTDSEVKFLSRGRGYTLFLTSDEAVLALQSSQSSVVSGQLQKTTDYGPRAMHELLPPLIQNPKSQIQNPSAPSPESQVPSPEPLVPDVVRLKLVGANPAAKVTGLDPLPGKSNYFIGNDPKKWRTNVANYAKVKYEEVYPGIDLVYYGKESGVGSQESGEEGGRSASQRAELEFDFVVAPGADPNAIHFAVETGNSKLENGNLEFRTPQSQITNQKSQIALAPNGDLVISTDAGEVRFRKPVVYQPKESRQSPVVSGQLSAKADDGLRTPDNRQSSIINRQFVDGRYTLLAHNHVGFELAAHDPSLPLLIDPVLSYSTYLGGDNVDAGLRVAVDPSGNAYVTGFTSSSNFPTTDGIPHSDLGPGFCGSGITGSIPCPDIFVTKLNPEGSAVVYSTFIGGSRGEAGLGIAVDGSGNVFLTGFTSSSDFPTTSGALQITRRGEGDAFVSKLNPTGSGLLYSTYFGGSKDESGTGIAVDSTGNAYVAGFTFSTDLPTTAGAFRAGLTSGSCDFEFAPFTCPDAFVAKFNDAGSALSYSTYLGGSSYDAPTAIAIDSTGAAYLTGITISTDFPTANPFQDSNRGGTCDPPRSPHPCTEAFVTKLNPTGTELSFSTYFGGSGDDLGSAIAVDGSNNAHVAGITNSTSLPATARTFAGGACGGVSNSFNCPDAFVAKFSSDGSTLAYLTYLGGASYDFAMGISVNAVGSAFVTGGTTSLDFPVTADAVQQHFGGGSCSLEIQGVPYNFGCPNAFLTTLNPAGSDLSFSTYLGGAGGDIGFGVATDLSGNVYLAGTTISSDFPTAGAVQTNLAGLSEAFAAKISPVITGPQVLLSPTSLSFGNQAAGTTSPPQGVRLTNNGDATLEITSISTSQEFSQTNDCGGSLPSSANCLISIQFVPDSGGSKTGELTIVSNAPGSPHTVALTGTGTDFALEVASGSSTSATVNAGQTATFALSLAPTGFSGNVSLACTESITAATCTVSPTSVTLDGTNPANVTVSVTTTARGLAGPVIGGPALADKLRAPLQMPAMRTTRPGLPGSPLQGPGRHTGLPLQIWLAVVLATLVMVAVKSRRVREPAAAGATQASPVRTPALQAAALAAVVLSVLIWAACGGGGGGGTTPPPQTGTPAGTYTVTVTATSGGLSRSTDLTVRVN